MALFEQEERTEPATPRKRQEARERGQVARSHDLTTALIVLAACLCLHFFARPSIGRLGEVMSRTFQDLGAERFGIGTVLAAAGAVALVSLEVILPIAAIVFTVAVAANLVQVGFLFTEEPLTPDLTRLDPLKGAMRIFSPRGLYRGFAGFVKIAAVGGILYYTLWTEVAGPASPAAVVLLSGTVGQAVGFSLDLAVKLALRGAVVILILAIVDFAVQRWTYERDLRMSKGELKEELRRMEGDPKIKERRRRVQQQLLRQRMMRDVPQADVVVTNPTHLAIAIRYDREEMAAPRVVAKGEGLLAQRIREIAMEHGVPIVERKELARALYRAVEIGQEIPPELYKAVAELLAYVFRMAGGAGAAGLRPGGEPPVSEPQFGEPRFDEPPFEGAEAGERSVEPARGARR